VKGNAIRKVVIYKTRPNSIVQLKQSLCLASYYSRFRLAIFELCSIFRLTFNLPSPKLNLSLISFFPDRWLAVCKVFLYWWIALEL